MCEKYDFYHPALVLNLDFCMPAIYLQDFEDD